MLSTDPAGPEQRVRLGVAKTSTQSFQQQAANAVRSLSEVAAFLHSQAQSSRAPAGVDEAPSIAGRLTRHSEGSPWLSPGQEPAQAAGAGAGPMDTDKPSASFERWEADVTFASSLLRSGDVVDAIERALGDGDEDVRAAAEHSRRRRKSRRLKSSDTVPLCGNAGARAPTTTGGHAAGGSAALAQCNSLFCLSDGASVSLARWQERIWNADPEVSLLALATDLPGMDPISVVSAAVFQRHRLSESLQVDPSRLMLLSSTVHEAYLPRNPFHNGTHAADVLYACHLAVVHAEGSESSLAALEPWRLASLFFAAMAHDLRHPGVTNDFLCATGDPLAVTYNDRSVLENFHTAEAFRLLRAEPGADPFHALDAHTRAAARKLVVGLVLGTDMADHGNQVRELEAAGAVTLGASEPEGPGLDRDRLLAILLHFADVSHPWRALGAHVEWSLRLRAEFHAQGDVETALGLPVSPMCKRPSAPEESGPGGDRQFARSQAAFLDKVIAPLARSFVRQVPGLGRAVETGLERAMAHWTSTAEGGA